MRSSKPQWMTFVELETYNAEKREAEAKALVRTLVAIGIIAGICVLADAFLLPGRPW